MQAEWLVPFIYIHVSFAIDAKGAFIYNGIMFN